MTSRRSRCLECLKYSPHPIYPFVMICLEDYRVVSGIEEECSSYIEKRVDVLIDLLLERGFLHCADCRQAIYSPDELCQHLEHRVITIIPPDEVSHEESPSAD